VDNQHILALVKAIYGADFYAVRVLTFNTNIQNNKGHDGLYGTRDAGRPDTDTRFNSTESLLTRHKIA